MNAGTLDTPILIQQPTEQLNELGDSVETWSVLTPAWAEVRHLKGRELVEAMQRVAEVDTKFTIWYSSVLSQITAQCRILVKATDETYDILEWIPIPGGRPEKLEILAKRRVD